jgi:hypothetical protein
VNNWVLYARLAKLGGPVNSVLAKVVYTHLAIGCTGSLASSFDCTRSHEGPARACGLTKPEFTRGINNDIDERTVYAKLFHGNLLCNGVDSLAHFGPTMTNFNSSIVFKVHNRSSDFFESISETAIFQTKAKTDGLS